MSKDNKLTWIVDWMRFYSRAHNVDAVILYDNGSTDYSVQDLGAAMEQVPEIRVSVIVKWPFKYGPQGGPDGLDWDSDFCQYGALEHAKWRFLRYAAGVISSDIDELVITPPGRSVFSYARHTQRGVIRYGGTWIESIPCDTRSKSSYSQFGFTNSDGPICPDKWCLIPSRVSAQSQWKVHGVELPPVWKPPWPHPWWRSQRPSLIWHKQFPVNFRHFKAINTGWKDFRYVANDTNDSGELSVDTELRDTLARLGL